MRIERELMRGAGPTAILKLLEPGEKYGYQLIQRLDQQSEGVLAMGHSTLYPMLYNLEAKGLIKSRVETASAKRRGGGNRGRPRKYYRLTGRGKKQLTKQQEQWEALAAAMGKIGVTGGAT